MKRRFWGSLVLLAAVVGCNTLLDNERATLRSEGTPTVVDPNEAAPGTDASTSTPRTGEDTTEPPSDDPDKPCANGKHLCHGRCVGSEDPAYGCGSATCEPCNVKHAAAKCNAGACEVAACDTGHADCNADPKDGCEADLSRAANCGACGSACAAGNPVCAPIADSYQCTTGCTAAAPLLCGAECVSPFTSVNHCGGCDIACPEVPNGTATCENARCAFQCRAGYHACGDKCAVDTDPKACGPTCAVCPDAPNADGVCNANACALECAPNFADCNASPADGCEANLRTDNLNCGACNKPCNGTCTNGTCVPSDAGANP